MSALFGVDVIICRFNPERTLEIIAAGNAACSFDNFEPLTCADGEITGQAEEAVDQPESEFAQNFAKVVWAANGSYCDVTSWSIWSHHRPRRNTPLMKRTTRR